MTLTTDTFETALAKLGNTAKAANQTIHHVVLNCHRSCNDAVTKIKQQIAAAHPNQLLYKLDLRTISHPEGNPDNWSLEACSATKSLGIVGESPTA